VLNPNAVRFEYVLPDKTKADYVLCDRHGRALAVLKHFDGVQVGLTATPCIANPEDFADDEDKLTIRDTLRFFAVEAPTNADTPYRFGSRTAGMRTRG